MELDRATEEAEGSDGDAAVTLDHISRSPHCSTAKARTLPGYAPRYSSLDAVQESVAWLVQNGTISASAGPAQGGVSSSE